MKSDTSHCCCYFRGIKVETKKGREPGRKRLVKQKVHVTLGKTEHMWAVIILTSTCKTWNTRGRMDKQKDERTAHSFQLEFLLFKTVFIKKKKKREREQKNKAILSDTCYSTWWLLCQQHIITSTGNQLSPLSVCIFLVYF